jgi:hypothetical protein
VNSSKITPIILLMGVAIDKPSNRIYGVAIITIKNIKQESKNTGYLFTQFGEPTLGGRASPFHYNQ